MSEVSDVMLLEPNRVSETAVNRKPFYFASIVLTGGVWASGTLRSAHSIDAGDDSAFPVWLFLTMLLRIGRE